MSRAGWTGSMDDMVLIFVLSLEDTTVAITHTTAKQVRLGSSVTGRNFIVMDQINGDE